MGHVTPTPAGNYRANWRDATGKQRAKTFPTRREAKAFLAETEATLTRGTYIDPNAGRQRFGDYAARWIGGRVLGARAHERTVSVQKVMGHESPSTTLRIYTHVGQDYGDAVRAAFGDAADDLLTAPTEAGTSDEEEGDSDAA